MSVINRHDLENHFEVVAQDRGNIIAHMKGHDGYNPDIYLLWQLVDRVTFREHSPLVNELPVIRVMSLTAEGCTIQFRAFQSLKGSQKERNLYAQGHFSKKDLEYILEQMNKTT